MRRPAQLSGAHHHALAILFTPQEGLHDRRKRAERKAHAAQRPRHKGEEANTAQRSDPFAQQVVQTFPNAPLWCLTHNTDASWTHQLGA